MDNLQLIIILLIIKYYQTFLIDGAIKMCTGQHFQCIIFHNESPPVCNLFLDKKIRLGNPLVTPHWWLPYLLSISNVTNNRHWWAVDKPNETLKITFTIMENIRIDSFKYWCIIFHNITNFLKSRMLKVQLLQRNLAFFVDTLITKPNFFRLNKNNSFVFSAYFRVD